MNMKREISIDDDPQGSREAVFKSSGDAGQRGSRRYYTLLESALWVFALGGWLRTFITCIRLFGDT